MEPRARREFESQRVASPILVLRIATNTEGEEDDEDEQDNEL